MLRVIIRDNKVELYCQHGVGHTVWAEDEDKEGYWSVHGCCGYKCCNDLIFLFKSDVVRNICEASKNCGNKYLQLQYIVKKCKKEGFEA